jgi:methionine-rich copper-binding protein CopC/Ca2+-binding RTX toxin-like protein
MAVANWTLEQVFTQLNSRERWSGSTITFSFPQTASGMFSQGEAAGFRAVNATQQGLMTLALGTWDDLITQSFVQGTPGQTNIEMAYTSTEIGYAHAYYPTIGSAWFNVTEDSLVNTALGDYGYQTFVHEIGHALGLDHMGDYNGNGNWSPSSFQDSVVLSIMSYFGPRYAAPNYNAEVMQADWVAANGETYSPQTPMLNDIMAIQRIYGASTTTRLDNTVYGFSSTVGGTTGRIYDFTVNRNPIITLFDSGGTDTLDLSGWATVSRISLKAGEFSSANDMTNNIAIAYNTVIENARAGSGNDVLGGNSAANRLEGGAGNDELNGLEGDDVLIGGTGNDIVDGGVGTDTVVFEGSFGSYTISLSAGVLTLVGAASGTDRVSNVERFQFADVLRTLAELSPGSDTTAPQLQSQQPADNAGAVAPGADLVLTFSEPVRAGSGTISIFSADGALVRSINASDTAQVRFNGNTATIDPSANLGAGQSYYVLVSAGAFTDLSGNGWAGISSNTAFNFSTGASDTAAPVVVTLTPSDNSASVGAGSNLVMLFNEPVVAGTGNIVIRNGSTVVATIAASDTSRVTITGSTVSINPSADMPANADLHVTVDAGALRDTAGNGFAGISAATTWNFHTSSGGATDDFLYATNTTGVVNVNAAGTSGVIETPDDADLFKVALVAGTTYTFTLQRAAGGGLSNPYLQLYGIQPNANTSPALITEDDDSGGAGNARISYTPTASGTYFLAAWDFDVGTGAYTISATTQDSGGPALVNIAPADNATQVNAGADLVLTFSEAVVRGTGSVRIYTTAGTLAREVSVSDTAAVVINGSTVTVNPGANLPAGTGFYVNIDANAFRDQTGNGFTGLSGNTLWNFSTVAATSTDDYPLSVSTGGQLFANGSAINARIDYANDGDLFKVQLVAGVTYRFDMISPLTSAVDPYIALYGTLPEVELITKDDDSGPQPLDARLYFTPTASGLYYLAAYDYSESTGSYSISSTIPTDDYLGSTTTNGRVTPDGAPVSGQINVQSDADMFAITMNAGTQYTIDLKSINLKDPYLVLFDGAGKALAHDDDTGAGFNSQITYTPAANGTYYVAASDFDTGTGSYSLSAIVRNVINGTPQPDGMTGTAGADTLNGGNGADTLRGQQGDDILDGGSGIDFAVYSGNTGAFLIQALEDGGWILTNDGGNQGRDLLLGVERLRFDDGAWAIDMDGSAGLTVKTLGAVFGKAMASNESYIGIGLGLLDGGMETLPLMQLALNAALGTANPSNTAVVDLLYTNLVGVHPGAADMNYFTGLIQSGEFTQASLALMAAEHPLNLTNIDWVELVGVGVGYV